MNAYMFDMEATPKTDIYHDMQVLEDSESDSINA